MHRATLYRLDRKTSLVRCHQARWCDGESHDKDVEMTARAFTESHRYVQTVAHGQRTAKGGSECSPTENRCLLKIL